MLLNKILDCHQYPRINESLVCTVLHLINHPKTRHYIQINTGLEVSWLAWVVWCRALGALAVSSLTFGRKVLVTLEASGLLCG